MTAGQSQSTQSLEAMEKLCCAYWYPLYAFARRRGSTPADAQDLTQGFFEHLLATALVAKADATKGKFRSFLLASFKNFIATERARDHAQKRGGGESPVCLDAQNAETRFIQEPILKATPESIYERSWAMSVLDQALSLMEAEFAANGRRELFERLHPFLQGDKGQVTYAEAGAALGTTEGTIKVTVSRMRHHYRELVRSVVAQTVTTPLEAEEEMRELVAVLRG